MSKKERKNRRIAKVYENETDQGKTFLNMSMSKAYKDKDNNVKGGRLLFEDAESGKLYSVKSASIFEANDGKSIFDIVIDIENDYQVEELG